MRASFKINPRRGLRWLEGLLLIGAICSSAQAGSRSSANYSVIADTADGGGLRSTSAVYSNEGSAGNVAGLSAAEAPATTVDGGFVAQLFDAPPVINSTLTAGGTFGSPISPYTITATNYPVSYGATDLPDGLSVDADTGAITGTPTAAGTFHVTISATNPGGTGTALLAFTIAKAAATVTLGSLSATYDGSPHSATATTAPDGLTVDFSYDGNATVPTDAGSYAVVGTISDTNYQGSVSGTLIIGKGTATVTLGSLSATYDGSAHAATATTSPTGLTVDFTYDGGATAPTNAGSYAVVGTVDDTNYSGSASGSLVIGKATATVTLGSLSATYNGFPHSATATTSPAGLTVDFTYDGGATAPTNAGSFAVLGTVSDTNHQGSASGTLVIAKAPLTATADDQSKGQGAANPALTITYTGFVNGETAAVLDTPPTASTTATVSSPVGTYPITLTEALDNNYAVTLQSGTLTVLTNGSLWAMGDNYHGQLGDGTRMQSNSPLPILSTGVQMVAAGGGFNLYVRTDGSLWAIGNNETGQLGDGTTTDRHTPVQILSSGVQAVAAGDVFSLILKTDGSLWAMGYNDRGELGDGTTTERNSPVRILSGGVQAIAAGYYHSLILKTDGSLWAMGANNCGQLGDGTKIQRNSPVRILSSGVQAIAAGGSQSLFLKTDGSLWAMGGNWDGQLGDGTATEQDSPVEVLSGGVQAIAAGGYHSLILKTDGSLWATGWNGYGQLGDGTTTQRNSPVEILVSGVQSISAGDRHSLILKIDGSLWAMGNNDCGQLGDGTTTGCLMPELIAVNALKIAAGAFNSLLLADGDIGLAPVVTTEPMSQTVTAGANAAFNAAASGPPTPALQWLVSTDSGSTWTNLTDTAPYSGTTTGTLTITGATTAMNGYQYRCAATNGVSPDVTSNAATLTVNKAEQTITFGALADKTFGDAAFDVSATASGGLPVTFSVASGPATIAGSTVTLTGAGTVTIRASQAGDANYDAAAPVDQPFTVAKAAATVALDGLSATYNGSAHSATATTTPSGLTVNFTYDGGATAPTNAGNYAVVGTVNDTNYKGSASGTLVIAKATATVTLGGLSATYNGSAHAATATTSPTGLAVNFTYNSSSTSPTNAGSYAVVGTISDTNYQGSASGTLVIGKATATVTLGSLSATYNGSAHAATATTSPSGLTVAFTYNSSSTAPTNAGSYAVVGTVNDTNYQGSASGTLVIAKAAATVTLGGLSATYNGSAHAATATTSPTGLAVTFTYNGSATAPTNAGSYAVVGTVNDTNYQGSASGTLVIAKATATVTLGSLSATYNGSAHAATATTSPTGLTVNFTYNGSATAPTNAGSYAVVGTISDTNYQGNASGTLVIGKAVPAISWPTPAAITYPTPLSATQLNAATSVPGTFVYSPVAGAVLSGGAHTLHATFTPADTVDYTGATASVVLTVNKAVPVITWAAPAAITYGTPLSATQLDATASVPGVLTYVPAAGTVLKGGTQTLKVYFVPTDSTDYAGTTATTTLIVNKAVPVITWAAPAAITYGTALSAAQLNASANVPGVFVYSPAVRIVLGAGANTLHVTFTPTDTTDYMTATATQIVTVNKAVPAITWPAPAAITYGTALSTTQLDATASVPGAFVYSPAAGAVLKTGTQTLRAYFTPTDRTDYTCPTATQTLTVTSAESQAFLQSLFQDVLGRGIDAGELSSFSAAMAGGESRAAVLGDLLGSAEYSRRQIEPAIRLCYAALVRQPDFDDLRSWSNALHGGVLTLNGAADQFASSPEFILHYGSLDNAQYVQQLYRSVLGREADAAELAAWEGQLNAGASRGAVLAGLSESDEFKDNVADQIEILRLHYLLLHRMPTPVELQNWQDFLLGLDQMDNVAPAQSYLDSWENYPGTLDAQMRDDLLADPAFTGGG
jgi:alpha-tubulin suppressor-like RCC1 family protein